MDDSPPLLQRAVEVRVEVWHGELHITPALVKEVPKWRAGHNVGAFWTPLFDCCFDGVDGTVVLQGLEVLVSLISQANTAPG
jgi:hypothetical protein